MLGLRPREAAFIEKIPSVCYELVTQGTLKAQLLGGAGLVDFDATPHDRVLQRFNGERQSGPLYKPKIRAMLPFLGDENGESKSSFNVGGRANRAA